MGLEEISDLFKSKKLTEKTIGVIYSFSDKGDLTINSVKPYMGKFMIEEEGGHFYLKTKPPLLSNDLLITVNRDENEITLTDRYRTNPSPHAVFEIE